MLVPGEQFAIGAIGQPEVVIDKPLTPAEIESLFFGSVRPLDVVQTVLQRELVLCSRRILTRSDLFTGTSPSGSGGFCRPWSYTAGLSGTTTPLLR